MLVSGGVNGERLVSVIDGDYGDCGDFLTLNVVLTVRTKSVKTFFKIFHFYNHFRLCFS